MAKRFGIYQTKSATARAKERAKLTIEAAIRRYAMEAMGKAHAIACDEYSKSPVWVG